MSFIAIVTSFHIVIICCIVHLYKTCRSLCVKIVALVPNVFQDKMKQLHVKITIYKSCCHFVHGLPGCACSEELTTRPASRFRVPVVPLRFDSYREPAYRPGTRLE